MGTSWLPIHDPPASAVLGTTLQLISVVLGKLPVPPFSYL